MAEKTAASASGATTNVGKHSVLVENRKRIVVAGVTEVISCDSDIVAAVCVDTMLVIHGEKMVMNSFDVKNGKLELDGLFLSMEYAKAPGAKNGGGFFSRLLK